MPSAGPDPHHLAHRLIVRYLRAASYASTAESFENEAREAGYNVGSNDQHAGDPELDLPDLISITEDYLSREAAAKQKQAAQDSAASAALTVLQAKLPGPPTLPYHLSETLSQLHTSNILTVGPAFVPRRSLCTSPDAEFLYKHEWHRCLATSAADKRVVLTKVEDHSMLDILEGEHKAAVLDFAQLGAGKLRALPQVDWTFDSAHGRLAATAGMDGAVVLYDLLELQNPTLQVLRHHTKFVVRVAFSDSGRYLASAGYDRKINIFRPTAASSHDVLSPPASQQADAEPDEPQRLAGRLQYELAHVIETPSNPEALLFLTQAKPGGLEREWLIYTIRGDSFLHYVALPSGASSAAASSAPIQPSLPPEAGSLEDRLRVLELRVQQSQQDASMPSAEDVEDWEEVKYNTNPTREDLHVSYSLVSASD